MHYPVFLDLKGRNCLVVGGGTVALRKVIALLRSDAVITVVSIDYSRHFMKVAHRITMLKKPFEESDIAPGLAVVIGATDSADVNKRISDRARELTIFCNIVDQPALCSFIVPAVVRRDPVTIAVSTGGCAPRLAKYCKKIAADAFTSDIQPLARYMGDIRRRLFKEVPDSKRRAMFWEELFSVDPLEMIASQGWESYRQRTEQLILRFKNGTGHEEN